MSADSDITISKRDYERLAEFRYTLRRFLHFSEHAAREVDLTPQQHQALLAIHGMPQRDYASVGELAERLQIRPHSAAEMASRLEHEGWLIRLQDEQDKRQVNLRLTPKGLATLASLASAHREELARLGPALREALNSAISLKANPAGE